MASNHPVVYKSIVGRVIEVTNRFKAVVEFQDLGSKQRALLKVEKLTCKASINPDGAEDHHISDFVEVGTTVRCLCHNFDETGDHKCGWFVADVQGLGQVLIDTSGVCPTMLNKVGWISHLEKRQGVISFKDEDTNIQHDVLFSANKFYIGGKRVNTKQPLDKFIGINEKVFFDALPIDPQENENHCAWIATATWKRSKPVTDYDAPIKDPDPNLGQIKMIIKNPKSNFIRGKGQIMHILSEEYGIALGAVNKQQTHWQSILFHRSCASLFKYNLSKVDLQQVFKEGDKIRFIAALAPKGFSAQWVASHIGIDVVGDAQKLVEDVL